MRFYYYIDNTKIEYDYSQYPANTTLGDIVTTDKLSHQSSTLTIGFEAEFQFGVTESIGVK